MTTKNHGIESRSGRAIMTSARSSAVGAGGLGRRARGGGFNQSLLLGIIFWMGLAGTAMARPGFLDETERRTLIYAREEEKLARDIYTILDEKWGLRPFSNIKHAEQRHMDAIKARLVAYHVEDPVRSDDLGSFTDPELKKRFEALRAKGLSGVDEAIEVGIAIEEADIQYLEAAIKETDELDLRETYSHLLAASRNHLAAFERWRNR